MNKETRKKQPEMVRARLLDAAAAIAVDQGLPALSLDAVARAAGVSKGGLLHHFPSRQALVEGLFRDLLRRLEEDVLTGMVGDTRSGGRFTRAYVRAVTSKNAYGYDGRLLGALMLAMSLDAALAAAWGRWMRDMLEKYGDDADRTAGYLARFAADGIWLEDSTNGALLGEDERAAVIDRLLKMTEGDGQ